MKEKTPFDPADIFLAAEISEEAVHAYLRRRGFRDPAAADRNFQAMAGDLAARQVLGEMAGLLLDSLERTPDPDSAVSGLERYLAVRAGRANFLYYLREDPFAL